MQKLLCVKLRALGDTVIWTAALNGLRAQYPKAEIHVLTYASNRDILLGHEAINELHVLNSKSRWELIYRLLKLRPQKYDYLLGFHATTSLCRWAWLSGAKQLVLHHHSWQSTPRGSLPIPNPGHLEDAIARDYQILKALGYKGARLKTSIAVEPKPLPKWPQTRPVLALLPGAAANLRRYPKDLWVQFVDQALNARRFNLMVLTDAKLSKEWDLAKICSDRSIPLFDNLSLKEFLGLLTGADIAVANDSGPTHMAAAMGLKTVTLFGPGCVGDWHPYEAPTHTVLWRDVDCRLEGPRHQPRFQFCTVESCSHHSCMRKITPNEILASI